MTPHRLEEVIIDDTYLFHKLVPNPNGEWVKNGGWSDGIPPERTREYVGEVEKDDMTFDQVEVVSERVLVFNGKFHLGESVTLWEGNEDCPSLLSEHWRSCYSEQEITGVTHWTHLPKKPISESFEVGNHTSS